MRHLPVLRLIFYLTFGSDNAMKANFLQRIREPSTWAGLSMLGVLFGLPPGTIEGLGQIIGGAAAIAAIFMAEKT